MTLHTRKNLFQGINPHLHSYWQAQGGWNNFHNPHIAQLARTMLPLLWTMGYDVEIEDSVQIRRADETNRSPRSDLSIVARPERVPVQVRNTSLQGEIVPLVAILEELPDTEKPYQALSIVGNKDGNRERIAWLELLSPSNKKYGADRDAYLHKRDDVLDSGLIFVELDYLHRTSPMVEVADYMRQETHSHPYRIVIMDPHPYVREGLASLNQFDVNQKIPTTTIPLLDDDSVEVDFDLPYQQQYMDLLYGLKIVDYTTLPLNFNRYSLDDQARIVNKMLAIVEAHQQGVDLENIVLDLPKYPLGEGLERLKALG